MFNMTRDILTMLGVHADRLRLEWISSAEGTRFAEVAREFTETVKQLGPSRSLKAA